jgi:stage III sporulation protein AF
MLAVVGGLVRSLIVIIFLNALLEMLLPQGEFRRYIRLVTGLIVILMVVGTIGALLGKAPRLEPVFGGGPAADSGGAAAEQSTKVGLTRQRHLLRQCRAGLEQLLREEIAAAGAWELVEAVLILDEDPESSTFGAPRQVDLLVQPGAEPAERVAPVSIEPVQAGSAAGEPGAGAGLVKKERLPELEQTLATLLKLAPEQVSVAAVDSLHE